MMECRCPAICFAHGDERRDPMNDPLYGLIDGAAKPYSGSKEDLGNLSDGYHTFNELYEHRAELYIALCRQVYETHLSGYLWRSRLHSDGSSFPGWFLLGIGTAPGSQITYHLPDSKWDRCNFAEPIERAPEFDGHTSADVVERLRRL